MTGLENRAWTNTSPGTMRIAILLCTLLSIFIGSPADRDTPASKSLTRMIGIPDSRGLGLLVFKLFHVDISDENLTAEHHGDPSRVCGNPNRCFIHSFRVTFLHMVFDPRDNLEGLDPTGTDLDRFPALDFQIQQVAILSSEDIEVKMVANFEVLAPGEIDRGNRINGIRRLIEFVFLYLASFVTMNRPFLRVSIELCFSVDDLL